MFRYRYLYSSISFSDNFLLLLPAFLHKYQYFLFTTTPLNSFAYYLPQLLSLEVESFELTGLNWINILESSSALGVTGQSRENQILNPAIQVQFYH